MTTAREAIMRFLRARVEANRARLHFIIEPSHSNLTRWVDLEEEVSDL